MSHKHPLRTESDYEKALARVFKLMNRLPETADGNSPEAEEFEILVTLIERYEDEHYPIGDPSPLGAIEFRMDQEGLRPCDLVSIIGSQTKVNAVLSGKQEITAPMAHALHERLGIPVEVLLNKSAPPVEAEIENGVSAQSPTPWGRVSPTPSLKDRGEEFVSLREQDWDYRVTADFVRFYRTKSPNVHGTEARAIYIGVTA